MRHIKIRSSSSLKQKRKKPKFIRYKSEKTFHWKHSWQSFHKPWVTNRNVQIRKLNNNLHRKEEPTIDFILQMILAALIALAAAEGDDVHADTTLQKSDVRHDSFSDAFESSRRMFQISNGDENGNVHGDFEWVGFQAARVEVKYVANEHGYQPGDNILRMAPSTPENLLRAIEQIKAQSRKEEPHV